MQKFIIKIYRKCTKYIQKFYLFIDVLLNYNENVIQICLHFFFLNTKYITRIFGNLKWTENVFKFSWNLWLKLYLKYSEIWENCKHIWEKLSINIVPINYSFKWWFNMSYILYYIKGEFEAVPVWRRRCPRV